MIGKVLRTSGDDLFNNSSLITEMSTTDKFLYPLSLFGKRITVGNGYGTDFLVESSTSLFLHEESKGEHEIIRVSGLEYKSGSIIGRFRTKNTFKAGSWPGSIHDGNLSKYGKTDRDGRQWSCERMDSLGWEKYVVDIRWAVSTVSRYPIKLGQVPTAAIQPKEFEQVGRNISSSHLRRICKYSKECIVIIPTGHNMIVANMKNKTYLKDYVNGRPTMDVLAGIVLRRNEEEEEDFK